MSLRAALPRSIAIGVFSFLFALVLNSAFAEEPEVVLDRLFESTDLKALSEKQPKLHVYRLTIIRSFHDPLQILIEQDSSGAQLIVKKARRETNGAEYLYTKLNRDSRLKLKNEQADGLRALLGASTFWSAPTEDWRRMGLDRSAWTLEAASSGKYHKVIRDNPFLPVTEFEKIEGMSDQSGLKPLTSGQAYGEGLLAAVFSYMWVLSGEDAEELY